MANQPHIERVVREKAELDEKRAKLDVFLNGDIFKTLLPEDRTLLRNQSVVMGEYSKILDLRLARFPK